MTQKLVEFSQIINDIKRESQDDDDEYELEEEIYDQDNEDEETKQASIDDIMAHIECEQDLENQEVAEGSQVEEKESSTASDALKSVNTEASSALSDQSELHNEFLDNTYWNVSSLTQNNLDIDALYAELEGF